MKLGLGGIVYTITLIRTPLPPKKRDNNKAPPPKKKKKKEALRETLHPE